MVVWTLTSDPEPRVEEVLLVAPPVAATFAVVAIAAARRGPTAAAPTPLPAGGVS